MEIELLKQSIWRRARLHLKSASQSLYFWASEALALTLPGYIASMTAPADWSTMQVIAYGLALTLGAVVAILIIVYGFGALLAARLQRNDLRQLLREKISDDEVRQHIDWLISLREEGVKQRNEGLLVKDEKTFEFWKQSAALWRGSVLEYISELSPLEAHLFETLDWVTPPVFESINNEHRIMVGILTTELTNLKAFIDKYIEIITPRRGHITINLERWQAIMEHYPSTRREP